MTNIETRYETETCKVTKTKKDILNEKEKVQAAIKLVKEGMSIKEAADHYGIAKTILGDRIRGKYSEIGKGRKSKVFKKQEETKLAEAINERAILAVVLTYLQYATLIQEYLIKLVETNP